MKENRTVLNSYAEALISTVNNQGIDEESLFSLLPVNQEHFRKSSSRLDLNLMTLLWQRAVQLTGDESLGLHVGQEIQQGVFHILGGLLLNCQNVETAIDQVVRYQALISEGGVLSLVKDYPYCTLQYRPAEAKLNMTHYQVEGVIASLVKFSRSIFPSGLKPLRVEFTHQAPSDISSYELFFSCPVIFNSGLNGVIFESKLLSENIPYSDPELFAHHWNLAEKKLNQITTYHGLTALVKRNIENEADWYDLSPLKTAQNLNLSLRQMQRKLNEEQTCYQKILDMARKQKSSLLIEQGHLTTEQIAEALAYHNLSSFHRAFKRWYDCTPAEYRIISKH